MRLNATIIYCVIPTPRESSESISSTPVCSKARLFERTPVFQMLFALDKVLVLFVSCTLASELGVANGRTLVAFVRVEVRVPTFPTTSAKCKVKSAKCKVKSEKLRALALLALASY